MAEISESTLADGSLDTNCEKFKNFIVQYSEAYLPETGFSLSEDSEDEACFRSSSDNRQGYLVLFEMEKAGRKTLISALLNQVIEDYKFTGVSVSINYSTDEANWLPVEGSAWEGAAEMQRLQKAIGQWGRADGKELSIFGRSYRTYVAELESTFAPGMKGVLQARPEIQIELYPSRENARKGLVKFVRVAAENFLPRNEGLSAEFMGCPDLVCLNDGFTYEISGERLFLHGREEVREDGGKYSSFRLFPFKSWPLELLNP